MELKPGYKQTEVGVIPEGWDVSPVGEKGQVIAGKALAVNALGKQRPYLRTKNVFDGRIDIEDVLSMPMTDEQFAQFKLRHGDVLLNEGQSLELVGRCSIYKEEYHEPCAIQNALLRFRANAGTSAAFASHLFRHCQQTGVFAKIALQTTSVAHLGSSRFANLKLAWPTENEQRLIATALDELDALLSSLEAAISMKTSLKQAAMQELLTGKRRLPGFEGEWEVKRLGDIATIDPENLGSNTHPHYRFNYISLEDVDQGSLLNWSEQEFSSSPSRARRKLRHNDVLVSTVRPNLKSHLLFSQDNSDWVCSTGFAILRCNGELTDPGYIYFHLFGSFVNKQIEALLTGSNYPAISSRDVRSLEIPVPALSEQKEIARILTSIEDEIIFLTQRLEKARLLKQGMMQQLLTGKIRLT